MSHRSELEKKVVPTGTSFIFRPGIKNVYRFLVQDTRAEVRSEACLFGGARFGDSGH